MSMDTLPAVHIDIMDRLDTATMDDLESSLCESMKAGALALSVGLHHFIRAGGILDEVRSRLPFGEYGEWLTRVGISKGWARRLTRLHHYRSAIPADEFLPRNDGGRMMPPSVSRALRSIADLPDLPKGPEQRVDERDRAAARDMQKNGLSQREIAPLLGVSQTTVARWLATPEDTKRRLAKNAEKDRQRKAAAAALREKEKRDELARLVKATTGDISTAYAEIRKALVALDRAASGAPRDEATSIRRAIDYCTAAESAVVKAMRMARTR